MWSDFFVRLLLAHVVGDFWGQTDSFCLAKQENGVRSWHSYVHAIIITLLSWLALGCWSYWWVALIIGASHWVVDLMKREDNFISFVIDQALHVLILLLFSLVFVSIGVLGVSFWDGQNVMPIISMALVFIVCSKPANIVIRLILDFYSVNLTQCAECQVENTEEDNKYLRSGKLIGTVERWLILIFMLANQYEAIGFLIAAKSIIRYKEGAVSKTEYVLAGTLLSVFLAVVGGVLLKCLI